MRYAGTEWLVSQPITYHQKAILLCLHANQHSCCEQLGRRLSLTKEAMEQHRVHLGRTKADFWNDVNALVNAGYITLTIYPATYWDKDKKKRVGDETVVLEYLDMGNLAEEAR